MNSSHDQIMKGSAKVESDPARLAKNSLCTTANQRATPAATNQDVICLFGTYERGSGCTEASVPALRYGVPVQRPGVPASRNGETRGWLALEPFATVRRTHYVGCIELQ